LADGHTLGVGEYGKAAERALDYVVRKSKPSGLLNTASPQRDMYNHGLSTFVLGQAYGMTEDRRLSPVLDRALKLISNTQCSDGGWDYQAKPIHSGHDLSLSVMQAKALRSAMDSGLEVSPDVVTLAIRDVRNHYAGQSRNKSDWPNEQGQFTYTGGPTGTVAMAAAGTVCMQEFGQYDDWRIFKSMDRVRASVKQLKPSRIRSGEMPFDAYTLYYVGQASYQVGGDYWRECYPRLRDFLVATQIHDSKASTTDGSWHSSGHVAGKSGQLFGTSVGCFILAIPNRYLPILQEGKIERFRQQGK
jgi:hypothetical protein